MLLTEQTKIHIHQYPFAETLNPILHKIIMDRADKEDMGAIMTDYFSFGVPEIIIGILQEFSYITRFA